MKPSLLYIFGEVLFDCFSDTSQVLGGAPFNVAWHAQALGDAPQLISRVGADPLGDKILAAMHDWQLNTSGIQRDPVHPTGRVEVQLSANEPSYTILPDCAYDFIVAEDLASLPAGSILYHGTLGLRNPVSRQALTDLTHNSPVSTFLDVNLRAPWWHKEEVFTWLQQARWVKLNLDELRLLGFNGPELGAEMARFQAEFQSEHLILTRGEEGALVRTAHGDYHQIAPQKATQIVDSVGAGDAFSAVYLHGLLAGWSITETLTAAQRLAGKIIGLRGATCRDRTIYHDLRDSLTSSGPNP
jgi:fructokinase